MMSAGRKPYTATKESGEPWLGRVPEHWRVLPGRACLTKKRQEQNLGLREKTVLSLSYGSIVVKPPDKLHGLVPTSFETYQIVDPLDIVVRPTDLQNDRNSLRFGLSRYRGVITSAYMCLRSRDRLTREYTYLLLHAYDLMKIFYGLGSGLRQNLSWADFRNLPCCVPTLQEQTTIVRFLDHADRRIRRYIRAKERLIELLEEQKQAIIHQAVTGQIDVRTGQPYRAYKDSGVEWLGDVPHHWQVRRLATMADMRVSNVDKHVKEGEHPVRLCNYVDVYHNERISSDVPFMVGTAEWRELRRFRLAIGDVLVTKDSEDWTDIAVPALVEYAADDLVCGYHLAMLRPNGTLLDGAYLFQTLRDARVAWQFHVAAVGVTRYGLSQNAMKSTRIPVPPLSEQTVIARFLDDADRHISARRVAIEREIGLLGEYRTRLIADVVTGKLDVREAAATLPDTDAVTTYDIRTDAPESAARVQSTRT